MALSEDDRHFARVLVAGLGRFRMRIGEFKEILADARLDADEAFAYLRERRPDGRRPVHSAAGAFDSELCWAEGDVGPAVQPAYETVTAVVRHADGVAHVQLVVDGRWIDGPSVELDPEAAHFTDVRDHLDGVRTTGVPEAWKVETARWQLTRVLFPGGSGRAVTAVTAVTQLLDRRTRVRLQLVLDEGTAALPWELVVPPGGRDPAMLSVVRLVGEPAEPRTTAWPQRPSVWYAAFGGAADGICYLPTVDRATRGFPRMLAPGPRPPGEFGRVLADPVEGAGVDIVHLVRKNGDWLSSAAARREAAEAIARRRPLVALLAICSGGSESRPGVTSLARQVAALGVPHVVALRGQGYVVDQERFARVFYPALLGSGSVDHAVTTARLALDSHQQPNLVYLGHGRSPA